MILDTTVLFDLVVDGPRSAMASRLIAGLDVITAPALIEVEIASALTRAVRRGELSADGARSSHDLAYDVMPAIEATEPLLNRAFELSLELQHPTPDCVFLALAERQGYAVATSDARFARKLTNTPYARLIHLVEA